MQDYQQNRKTAGSNAFNQSAFGSTTQPSTSTTLFGQSTQPQPANSMFGSFGNAGASSAAPGSTFGGLGQTSTQPTGGFGAFNQAQQPAQQPAPQPAPQPATSGFGSFNQAQQPQPQPQNTGLFGGGSAFAAQNKPLGGFGMYVLSSIFISLTYRTTGSTGGFGTSSNTGSTGLFGQANATQQQQPASTGLFAQNQPAGGAFGGGAFGVCYTIEHVLQLTRFEQVPTLLARNHPYSGRPNNNQQRVAALGCLDLSNSRALQAKLSRAQLDCSEISQDLDRLTQPRRDSHNKVDVRCYSWTTF